MLNTINVDLDQNLRFVASVLCLHSLSRSHFGSLGINWLKMSRDTAFTTKLHVRPTMTQVSLRIRAVWSEFSQGTLWVVKDPELSQAGSEDSVQTAPMRRLIWVFTGRTCSLAGNTVPRLILILFFFCRSWFLVFRRRHHTTCWP